MAPTLIDLASLAGGAIDGHVIAALERAGHHGLRARHGYVVQRLLAGDRTVTEIARSLAVTQQAMSKTVAELERLGYIDRNADPDDARRRSLTLSARGLEAIQVARASRADLLARVTAAVGDAHVAVAEDAMRAILDVLGLAGRVDRRAVPDPTATAANVSTTDVAPRGGEVSPR